MKRRLYPDTKICPQCGEPFSCKNRGRKQRYCSEHCRYLHYKESGAYARDKERAKERLRLRRLSGEKKRSYGNKKEVIPEIKPRWTPGSISQLHGDKFLVAAQSIIDRDVLFGMKYLRAIKKRRISGGMRSSGKS